MPEAKLTSKGQVTIPKEVRDALNLETGDRVQFFIREDGTVELRPRTVDLRDLYGLLERRGKTVTVEEMNEAIRRAAVKSFEKSVAE